VVFQLFGVLRKTLVLLLLTSSIGCMVAVFASRLPDQEVCIHVYYSTSTQPFRSGELILDTNSGRITPETRGYEPITYIFSPDDNDSLYAKPMPHQPDLFALYLQEAAPSSKSRLLQPAIRMAGGNGRLTGDQIRWSHDSQRVAYLWSNSSQDFFLSIANMANNQIKTVTPFAKDPSKAFYTQIQEWSPDNRYLTVIDQILNRTHYTFWDTETWTAVDYPLNDYSLARGTWSPNGHRFAALVKNENLKPSALVILDLDQPDAAIQVPLPKIDIQHLMWSPDGNALTIGYLTCGEPNCHSSGITTSFKKTEPYLHPIWPVVLSTVRISLVIPNMAQMVIPSIAAMILMRHGRRTVNDSSISSSPPQVAIQASVSASLTLSPIRS
jgi:hypothetical protein